MPFFKYGKIQIYYENFGSGFPLLLINGLSSDTRSWEPLIRALNGKFQIISYDMRSAGKSDKPHAPLTISDLSNEAHALAKYLGYDKFCVLGFSMGGMIAMDLALKHPEAVRKMFLVATAASFKRPYPLSGEVLALLRRTDISYELLAKVYEIIFGPEYRKKVLVDDFVKFRMEDENPQPADAYLNQLGATATLDLSNDVQKISVPTCIVTGDSDKLIPPENSSWLHEHISGSELHTLNGVGHMVPIEAPPLLAEILAKTIQPS